MTSEVMIPLIAALVGALIGSLTSIATMWFQQRAQSRRERLKVASELAMQDYKNSLELAKTGGKGARVFPVATYQHFHYEILTALDEGNLNRNELHRIKERNHDLMRAFEEVNRSIEHEPAVRP